MLAWLGVDWLASPGVCHEDDGQESIGCLDTPRAVNNTCDLQVRWIHAQARLLFQFPDSGCGDGLAFVRFADGQIPVPRAGQLLDLNWSTFGFGIERLARQIKNLGQRLDADICFGINEAGLVMATFLASDRFSRCAIGYLRCNKAQDGIDLDEHSYFPAAREFPIIVICDFEVKHADAVGFVTREIRSRYANAQLYFAVFGAMTKAADLKVGSFDDLTGERIMRKADFSAVFIAATMSPPGIEPSLELR
jgi:hypothetical protein